MARLTRWQKLRISAKHRLTWYEAMAKAIGDGKGAYRVVEVLAAEYGRTKHPMEPLLRELARRMAGGHASSKSTGRVTLGTDLEGLVPANEANLIDAGESSGRLEDGFIRAAEYLKATGKLREEVLSPLVQPVILLLLLIGVLVFFSFQILPTFTDIAPRAMWPRSAQMYGRVADNALLIAASLTGTLMVGTMAFVRASERWSGDKRALADRYVFPFTMVKRVNAAALLTSLSGYVAAGVKFDQALEQLQSTSSPYMRTIYGQLLHWMRNAARPDEALCQIHLMDRDYHWMIRLYGDSSDFPGAMRRISEEVIEMAIDRTRKTFAVVNLLLRMLVAGFIVWTMGSLFGIVMAVRAMSTGLT